MTAEQVAAIEQLLMKNVTAARSKNQEEFDKALELLLAYRNVDFSTHQPHEGENKQ